MIPVIAWRNIWRHKLRSIIVILSIAIGLWAGVFMVGFSWGMYRQYMRETVETQLSHIQVHHPRFEKEDHEPGYIISQQSLVAEYIRSIKEVKAVTLRIVSAGMAASPTTASGINIYGIIPSEEDKVTGLRSRIISGNYLDTTLQHPVLIGEKLAKKLKVKLKRKIVVTFQDIDGQIVSAAFRVSGIYRSKNTAIDETNIYVLAKDLSPLLNTGNSVQEIAVLLKNGDADHVKEKIKNKFPHLDVKTWKELSPELELVINSFNEYMYIFVGFILLALTFGIINTMLMAVLERVREIGMLMAVGMNKFRIFAMVMLETIFLALTGGIIGLLLGYFTIHWTGNAGINISIFSEGLSAYGFSSIVYPQLESSYYLPLTLMTIFTAVLSAIYPAVRAIKLNPAEAIRKI